MAEASRANQVIAVTMGDPGGIGPEIVVSSLAPPASTERWPGARFVVYGSSRAMHDAAELLGIDPFWWRVERGTSLMASTATHDVVLVDSDGDDNEAALDEGRLPFERRPSKSGGRLSYQWVEDAIAAAKAGDVGAVATAPISKTSWHMAGHRRFPGHTELFASRFNVKRAVMMFEGPRLRVSLATVHVPLMDVRDVLTIGKVYDAIDLGAEGCRRLGVDRPRLGVCGLNPHAGESGLMGDEESRLIEPAIQVALDQGLDVRGPFPADTIFTRAIGGEFDLVVAMYHDQGLIPVKLLDRDRSVNVTVGLPIVRTSPDHGTAFDIAGRGVASAESMASAIDAAWRMLGHRAS
ncbi:MAG: 4-hydroxythreonine-4-phosphate dehydrogenase PdxA [Phycisphaerae bacterium]|nr:4-hydroxythreonine-4-phosphate dehydrogenase PdxA [Phycisphaerae bacterium]